MARPQVMKHQLLLKLQLSRLRDETSVAAVDFLNDWLPLSGLELHSRAIVGSAKVSWVVDIPHTLYLSKGFLSILDTQLRFVNAIQTSLNDWLESGRPTLLYSICKLCWYGIWEFRPEEPSEDSIPSYAVVVSAVVLLSLVYQYLTGNVDRGGSKAYSRSSLDFRDIYVAIVLFLGAYVWIKFREVAPRGVHPRKVTCKQGGTKWVYEARLTPPNDEGQKVPRLDLGRFATPQEAHNKFLIAAFYYNRDAGLLDGWFQVPPMSEEERCLTGEEKRKWVLGQAKKVYEDFKKGAEAEATLVQDLYEACEGQATQEREGNVDSCGVNLLNLAEHQQPALVSQAENSGMGMSDNYGFDCASHSFDGMHEGPALSNGHSFGSLEGSALPVSQLPPNIESGISLNGSDQLDILQTLVRTLQQQISLQQQQSSLQQQFSDQQQQISRRVQELDAQMLQFQHHQGVQQQQKPQEFRIQNPQWSYQSFLQEQQLQDVNQGVPPSFEMEVESYLQEQQLQDVNRGVSPSFEMEMESYLQEQLLQDVNQGVPRFEMEMEQSMQEHNYSSLMALRPDGWEF